jgi:hypothetical protein
MYQNLRHVRSKNISLSKRTVCSLTARTHDGGYQLRWISPGREAVIATHIYLTLITKYSIFRMIIKCSVFLLILHQETRFFFSLTHTDDHLLFLYQSADSPWIKSKFVCLIDYVGIIIRCPSFDIFTILESWTSSLTVNFDLRADRCWYTLTRLIFLNTILLIVVLVMPHNLASST